MEVYKETKRSFKESDGRKDEYFYFKLLESSEKEEENRKEVDRWVDETQTEKKLQEQRRV